MVVSIPSRTDVSVYLVAGSQVGAGVACAGTNNAHRRCGARFEDTSRKKRTDVDDSLYRCGNMDGVLFGCGV
jgi:hypothetical protein